MPQFLIDLTKNPSDPTNPTVIQIPCPNPCPDPHQNPCPKHCSDPCPNPHPNPCPKNCSTSCSTSSSTSCPKPSSDTCSTSSSDTSSNSCKKKCTSSSTSSCSRKERTSSESRTKSKKKEKDRKGSSCAEFIPTIRTQCVVSETVTTNRLLVNGILVIPDLFVPPLLTVSTLFGADSGAPLQLATNLSNEIPIPQGVYPGTPGFPVINPGTLPNFYALISSEDPETINNWEHSVRIYSKIFIRNSSNTNSRRVAYSLYAYSRNELNEQTQLLDIDIHTLQPDDIETFTVDWFIGKQLPVGNTTLPTVLTACEKTLPAISGVRSMAIFTAVSLIGTTGDLADLRTFALTTDSVKRNILIYYRTFTAC